MGQVVLNEMEKCSNPNLEVVKQELVKRASRASSMCFTLDRAEVY